jgi:hypothetical protein
MINEEVLTEKLKYLITMNAKPKMFDIMNVFIELDYVDQEHTKLLSYDVDVKFDYQGPLEFDLYSFSHDIQRMSEKIRDIVNEYIITEEGKLVSSTNSNCYTTEPIIFSIDYKVDETHIFDLGFKFNYAKD